MRLRVTIFFQMCIDVIGEPSQQCPIDFPYSFEYGKSCCKYGKDNQENSITIQSGSCLHDAYRPCIKDRCVVNSK